MERYRRTPNDRESVVEAFRAAKQFIGPEKPKPWLYLHGPSGVGKTHLAVAIANSLLGLNKVAPSTFGRPSDLLDRLRQTFAKNNDSEDTFFTLFETACNAENTDPR